MRPNRCPLTDVTSNHTTNSNIISVNKLYPTHNAPKKKSKSYTANNIQHDDNLSNPFQTTLNLTSISPDHTAQNHKPSSDSSQDDDIKKPSTHTPTPQQTPRNSIPCTPNTKYMSCSLTPSPGVVKSKQNIASPQRIPSISLRSFHTVNHIEFYKPIPINECRSTQFEILNETYDDKAIQIKNKHNISNYISCINISPTAMNLKRNTRCLVTVSCRPRHAMRIKEVINIEWDLHSIQLYVHAVGFRKRLRTKQRGHRKRSLRNMRKEDDDKCNSAQSSMESTISSTNSNSITNSIRKRRKKRSPTIRREKAFTAAPFSSPAPFKLRKDFLFQTYDECKCSLTPKEFKKRRVIDPVNDEQRNPEIERFEKLCTAVLPIQCIFRCYLAQKRTKRIMFTQNQQHERQQYYIDVIRSHNIAKRVRTKYLQYKNAANVIQCAVRTYCRYKECKMYIEEVKEKERQRIQRMKEESAVVCIQGWFRGIMYEIMYREYMRQKREEEERIERKRIQRLKEESAVYIQSWFKAIMFRRMYKGHVRRKRERMEREEKAVVCIQSWFKGIMFRRMYRAHLRKKRERIQRMREEKAAVCIQSWFIGCMFQIMYTKHLIQKRKEEEERLRRERMIMDRAARDIQSWFKGMMFQRMYKQHVMQKRKEEERLRIQRMRMDAAAGYIQSWFKGMMSRRMYRKHLMQKRKEEEERLRIERMRRDATVYIQSWFKGVMFQRMYRKHLIQKRKEEQERLRIERMRLDAAARYIQSWFKGMMFQRMYKQHLLKKRKEEEERLRIERMRMNAAAGYIQLWFKGVMFQRMYRKHVIQKRKEEEERLRIERMRMDAAARYIQSWFKGIMFQRMYKQHLLQKRKEEERLRIERMRMDAAAGYIQSWFKGIMFKRMYRKHLIQKRKEEEERLMIERMRMDAAARYIQSWFKGMMFQRMYKRHLIQKRKEEERLRIQRMRMDAAAGYIQSWFKGVMFQIMYRQHMIQQRRLQEKQQREGMLSQYISCMIRCRNTRKQYVMLRESSIVLESVFKGYIMRKRYKERCECTVLIQSYIRSKLWRNQYLMIQKEEEKHKCVFGALALWRLHEFHEIIREKHRKVSMANGAAAYIQGWFRGAMYRKTYILFMEEELHEQQHYVLKVVRVQALIRGKLMRMECAGNSEMRGILNKLRVAHRNWKKQNTVNYLLNSALRALIDSRTLYGVSEACDTLQNLLQIVPNISDRIVQHNVIGALYNVLRNSNRSLPHLNLVDKILNFLLFFASVDGKCYSAIFDRNDTLDILSERLQIHRLDFALFELTTQLFFVGVDMNVVAQHNTFLLNLRQSDVNRQIRTVQKIMCSKLEIAKRVNKPLRKISNAKCKHKIKFEQERILTKCVHNMHKLVDKL